MAFVKISKKKRNHMICSVTESNILLPSSFSGLPPHSYNTQGNSSLGPTSILFVVISFVTNASLGNIVAQDFSLSQDIFYLILSFA